MQDNNEAGASPAPADRLDELEQWANDLPRRLAGGSDRGITRWAAAQVRWLRLEVMARDVLLERSERLGIEDTCLCEDCREDKLAAIRDELAAL